MKLAIVTGASKGLGASIAKKMIHENIGIITISRTESEELKQQAASKGVFYQHFACNLGQPEEIEALFNEILPVIQNQKPEELFVFNNAGAVNPIATAGSLEHTALIQSVHLNIIAPMMISNILLNRLKEKLRIVNISSGAGERPIQGWSVYCSTKAALNMFTETAALEQKTAGTAHEIIAFSPGIMDTGMQGEIRSSSKEAFHDLEKFQDYKEKGMLRHTDTVADALICLLLRGNVESGRIYNVNDLL